MDYETRWLRLHQEFRKYRAGDEHAVDAFFLELEPVLKTYLKRKLFNETEVNDVCQTVLLKIHMSRFQYCDDEPLKNWIFTIASRSCIDFFRSNKRFASLKQNFEVERKQFDAAEARDADLWNSIDGLEKAAQKLKPIDREIISLQIENEMSIHAIASQVGMTEGAVKVRLHRAFKALRGLLPFLLFYLWRAM